MDYELILIKTLERVSKNYYYIIRGERKMKDLEIWKKELEEIKDTLNQQSDYDLHRVTEEIGGGGSMLGNFSMAYPQICS